MLKTKKITAIMLSAVIIFFCALQGLNLLVSATIGGPFFQDFENAAANTFYANSVGGANNRASRGTTGAAYVVRESGIGRNNSGAVMRLEYTGNYAEDQYRTMFSMTADLGGGEGYNVYRPNWDGGNNNDRYHKVTLWYKAESLTCAADIVLGVVNGSLRAGNPDGGRIYTRTLARLEATNTQGEWVQASGIIRGFSSGQQLTVELFPANRNNCSGSSVLFDDITVETVLDPVQVNLDLNGGTALAKDWGAKAPSAAITTPVTTGEILGEAGEPLPLMPINPTKNGLLFDGWYTDSGLTTRMPSNMTFPASTITLYAKWISAAPVINDFDTNPTALNNFYAAETTRCSNTADNDTGLSAKVVSQQGIGHEGSSGAMRLKYNKNSSLASTDWRACFALHDTVGSNQNYFNGPYRPNAGKVYKVTLWYKIENLPCDAELLLEITNGSLRSGKPDAPESRETIYPLATLSAASSPGEWIQVSGVVAGVASTRQLVIDLNMSNHLNRLGASVLFDDITIEVLVDPVLISFNSDGGSVVADIGGEAGGRIVWPQPPVKNFFAFDGWYTDAGLTTPVSPNMAFPSSSITVYAKWKSGSTLQDYETFAAKSYGAFDAGGIHGNSYGREVSSAYNHTPGGSKSVKIKMNNTYLTTYGQTVANLDGLDVKWQKDVSYTISFWVMMTEDIELIWRVASAGGPLDGIGNNNHTIEKEGKVNLQARVWKQVTVKVNKVTGIQGNMWLSIGGLFETAGAEVSNPADDYKLTKYMYIDDVYVAPVFDMPQVIFNTGTAEVTVPAQSAFGGEPFNALPTVSRAGWLLDGWYNSAGDVCYGNDSIMPDVQELNMYAKWIAAPTAPYSFETGFEADEYNSGVQPYANDKTNPNISTQGMTHTATWLKDGGLSAETGDGAMTLVNSGPYVDENGKLFHSFALVNPDGSLFTVVKGAKYRITYSYMGDANNSGHSYVAAVISDKAANLGVGVAEQVLNKNVVHCVTDWFRAEECFQAGNTGFVYLSWFARSNSLQMNSENHIANIDNVKVEVLDNSYISVEFKDGGSNVAKLVGKSGTKIPMPAQPAKSGQIFTAWYTDSACTQKYNSWNYPEADTVLYAGFAAADYSNGVSDFANPILLSFEETDMLKTWLWSPNRMEWSEDSVAFVEGDTGNARTGKNYIRFNAVPFHWTNRYLSFYDPNSKNNVLYLDPNSIYKVSYWYKLDNDFSGVDFNLCFNNPSGALINSVSADKYLLPLDEITAREWVKVEHKVETGSERVSLSLTTNLAAFSCAIDDISVQKVKKITVKFNSNGGSAVDSLDVLTGFIISDPLPEPYKDGFIFSGWYTDSALTKIFDVEKTEVQDAMTLYAKWKPVETVVQPPEETKNPDKPDEPDEPIEPDEPNEPDKNENNNTENNYDEDENDSAEAIDNGRRPELLATTEKAVTPPSPGETEKGFPWLIVGISAGAVLLAAAGLILFLILRKKKKEPDAS